MCQNIFDVGCNSTVTKMYKFFLQGNKLLVSILIYGSLVFFAVVLPVIIWQLKVPIISRTYDGSVPGMLDSQPFELFGLFISLVLIFAAWSNVNKQEKKTLKNLIPIILPLLVSLQILFFLIEHGYLQGSDYALCYEKAAQAIVKGVNPYSVKCFLYPPLQAQVLGFLYQVVNAVLLFPPRSAEKAWDIVFYFYQCAQYIQILLAYYLTYELAKRIGLRVIPATVIVSALFLFNNPLVRTIEFNQINVWILNCFLLAILWLPRHPFFSGLAVSLGAHIKLYTLSLLLPWTLTKNWKSILGAIAGFFGILILQSSFGQNFTLWQQFLVYFTQRVEKPSNYRNSGIWSFFYNLVKIPERFTGDSIFNLVSIVVLVINLLFIAWFVLRIIKREKAYLKLVKSSDTSSSSWYQIYRDYGNAIDAVALGLLISPSVWEHHYVIAIPIALWAIVTRGKDRPWLAGVGTFLIFCLPTFDVFPLSHHRMVGLLILVYATSPNFVQQYFLVHRPRNNLETSMDIG